TLRCAPLAPMVLPLLLTRMPLPLKPVMMRLLTTQPLAASVRPSTPAPAEVPLRVTAPMVCAWTVVAWLSAGRALVGEMVPVTVKLMVCGPAAPFADVMAARSEPPPLLLVLLTVKVVAPRAPPVSATRMATQAPRIMASLRLRSSLHDATQPRPALLLV